ncbi:hypothetical protein [Pararhodobacter oceanensis]|uniref:hypothetical protein n=1 Tax=Pararhodobacter oceanensis TaxID=2172121 RepID=UPI003A8CF46A
MTDTTLDTDGWLTLPFQPAVKPGVRTALTLACAPSWLAEGKAQILDHHALIAINRRIAKLRTSGAMEVVTTLETLYRKHTALCPYDAKANRIQLPARVVAALGPAPCTLQVSKEDGHLTLRKSPADEG